MSTHHQGGSTARYEALLFITAAIWGTGFVAQRLGMQSLGPLAYNAARFAVGSLALVPLLMLRRIKPATVAAAIKPGLLAGSVLAIAAGFQQAGLQYTSAGKAGFITGLYVVLVPIAAIFIGKKTSLGVWAGAALALAGLYVLSVSGVMELNQGDVLVFISTFFWTSHILVLDRWASKVDPVSLACVQFGVASALFWICTIVFETPTPGDFYVSALPIAYGGLFSIGIAYTLQAVGQSKAHPSRAAIIMSLESPFAAIAGFFILGERLGVRELLGCVLMLGGMILAQLAPRSKTP
jgi:drug/metabolite transporter (DMT)-like permease